MKDREAPLLTPLTKTKHPYLLATGAFFSMALFAIFTRTGLKGGSPLAVSILTYAFGVGIAVLFKPLYSFKSERKKLLIGRGLFGVLASFCYTLSMVFIPVTNSTLFLNTAPLFIAVLSMFWIREKVSLGTWFALFVGFLGVLLVVQPQSETLSQSGNLFGLSAGISLAIAYFFMKLLSDTEPPLRIIFYYLLIGFLIQLPFFSYFEVFDSYVYLFTFLAAFCLFCAQLGLIKAYQVKSATKIGVLQYLSVVFVGLIEWLFFDTLPNKQELFGMLLVVLGVFTLHK